MTQPQTAPTKPYAASSLTQNGAMLSKQPNYIGRILLVTTKTHILNGRQWLDTNLPVMFMDHLAHHPKFIPDEEYPIAQCADKKTISHNMQTYAEAIKNTGTTNNTGTQTNSKFLKPPKNPRTRMLTYGHDDFPKLTETTSKQTIKTTSMTQTTQKTNQPAKTDNTITANPPSTINNITNNAIDIKQIQNTIMKNISQNIQQQIQQQLQVEIQPMKVGIHKIKTDMNAKYTTLNTTIMNMQAQLAAILNILLQSPTPMSVGDDN